MARIEGKSETKLFVPKIRLISSSTDPIGTLITMWIGTRSSFVLDPHTIENIYNGVLKEGEEYQKTAEAICSCYPEYAGEDGNDVMSVINNLLKVIIRTDLPLLDSINFVFEIDYANVAWREQVVRSRRPQNFWTQSSRTMDLTTMDVNRLDTIESQGGEEAVKIYNDTVDVIRQAYKDLIALGVSSEDIRLAPQGMLHRVYWMVPYRTLSFVLSKRISWIAQSSLWTDIVSGIQSELYKNCKFFANIIGTPVDVKIENDQVVSYKYDTDNEDRYQGRDYQPCDPLWLAYKGRKMPKHTDPKIYADMKKCYLQLWSDEVCKILGWDKNDPSKKGPYDVLEE